MPARLLVFGIDGTDWDLLDPLIAAGRMPAFKAFKERSCWGRLSSTNPPITPAAWTSSFTGVNPGAHGIFDFFQRYEGSYGMRIASSKDNRRPTVFRLASSAGKSVCALNIPFAYPPEAVNGILMTGFGTPSGDVSFIHPPEARAALMAHFKDASAQPMILRYASEARLRKDIAATTEGLRRGAAALLAERDWDLFLVVFDGTDRLQHRFWRYHDQMHPAHPGPGHPYAGVISEHYEFLDRILAELLGLAGADAKVLSYSDHGFGPARSSFFLNRALEEAGFLAWRPGAKSRLRRAMGRIRRGVAAGAVRFGLGNLLWKAWSQANRRQWRSVVIDALDWSRTRAFASSQFNASVRLNLRGREPEGCVDPADAPRILSEVRQSLLSFRDPETGEAPILAAVPREEVYRGERLPEAPDLVVSGADGVMVRHGWNRRIYEGLNSCGMEHAGDHRPFGMFALDAPGAAPGRRDMPPRIEDIAPTILEILGIPIPEGLDGTSLLGGKPSAPASGPSSGSGGGSAYTPEEEEAVKRRLEDLGYL